VEARQVVLGDAEIALFEAGVGGRPVLVVHGFTGGKEDFIDHIDPLAAQGWHVVVPDLRGHGASFRPARESEYSLELCAADQAALVDALGWDRFALVGYSMGGMLTQLLALKAPDRVAAYVLMDTSPGPVPGLDAELMRAGAELVRTEGLDVLADLTTGRDGPLDAPASERVKRERPGFEEWCDHRLRSCSPAMYAALITAIVDQDDRLPRFDELTMPTLVIVGEQDQEFLEPSRVMAEALPDGRLVVVPDAGHGPQFENPTVWYRAVTGFLREVGA
jgi:pimeloyl-ACP methyl ester carboxylesterase